MTWDSNGARFLALVVAGTVTYVSWRIHVRQKAREEKERLERETIEALRRRDCEQRIEMFGSVYDYLGEALPSFQGAHELMEKGASPEDVRAFLAKILNTPGRLILGASQFFSRWFDIYLTPNLRSRHVYVIGKSGYGKTTLLRSLIAQDLKKGAGLGVLAPEYEMVAEDILPIIPEHRIEDVIYFNPEDFSSPVVLNPLHLFPGDDIDIQADETFTVLQRIVGDGGPRMDEILRHSLFALLERPGSSLLDFDALLDREDPRFRKSIIETTSDPLTRRFFSHSYPQMPSDAHLPILNRIGKITRSKYVRNCLCPPEDAAIGQGEAASRFLNIRRAMDSGKILLFNLSDGRLGEAASQLIGQLIVSKFQIATMGRADVSSHQRTPYYLYLDEFQNFCGTAAKSYEKILSRARKYRLGLILAHQQTGQLPLELTKEILGNVSTILSFQLSPSDASRFAKVFENSGWPDWDGSRMLQRLEVGETACRIAEKVLCVWVDRLEDKGSIDIARRVVKHSREKFGIPRKPKSTPGQRDASTSSDPLENIDPDQVF